MKRPIFPKERIIEAHETIIVSGERIVLEGDNQKQADPLTTLAMVDSRKLHDRRTRGNPAPFNS
jgi:malonate decarboxylase alpha subunit